MLIFENLAPGGCDNFSHYFSWSSKMLFPSQAHGSLELWLQTPRTHRELLTIPPGKLQKGPTVPNYGQQNTSPTAGTSMQMNLSKDLIT